MLCHTSYQIHTCGLSRAKRVFGSVHTQLRKGLHYLSTEFLDTLYLATDYEFRLKMSDSSQLPRIQRFNECCLYGEHSGG